MKTKLSPASREKLIAAAKARWAKQRKAKGADAARNGTTAASSPRNGAHPTSAADHVEHFARNGANAQRAVDDAIAQAGGAANGGVQLLDPATIERSPFNRTIDQTAPAFRKLVADVRENGVLQNGIVRPLKTPRGRVVWQLIAGERRWLAATSAGRPFPAAVRDVDDTKALELQFLENHDRDDLNPIEEAEKFAQLKSAYMNDGTSAVGAVEKIARMVGLAPATVHAQIALLKLPDAVRELVLQDKLPKSHAELLGKIDDPKVAAKLAAEMLKPHHFDDDGTGVVSFRSAKVEVEREVEKQDRLKKWQSLRDEFTKRGDVVLSDAENKTAFDEYGSGPKSSSAYVAAEQSCDKDPKYRTWKALLGKDTPKPVLGRARNGTPVVLYPKADALAALKNSGKIKAQKREEPKESAAERQRREAHEKRVVVFHEAMRRVVEKVESGGESDVLLRLIVSRDALDDEVAKRRRVPVVANWEKQRAAMAEYAKGLSIRELRGLLAEHTIAENAPSAWQKDWSERLLADCALFGVDLLDLEKQLQTSGGPQI